MREALTGLGVGVLDVVTDADIALFGATEGEPGVCIIAGTGSVCLGRGLHGAEAWAGGWGPLAGDEGSGAWIARQALQRIAQAADGRGRLTTMSAAAVSYFEIASVEDLSAAIYSPSMTNDRIAGFSARVIRAAQEGDGIAIEILRAAGEELGRAAATVIRKLDLEQAPVIVAYTGGVFTAGELVLDALRKELSKIAPRHQLVQPRLAPALAAAQMAQASLRQHLALAG
jgi:N-acetylglucosamine kinase-like BadF-type ATPase